MTQYIYLEEEQLAFVSCKSRVIAMLKGTDWTEDANTFMIHVKVANIQIPLPDIHAIPLKKPL